VNRVTSIGPGCADPSAGSPISTRWLPIAPQSLTCARRVERYFFLLDPLLLELLLLELLLLLEPELFDPPDFDAALAIYALLLNSGHNRSG
jgi:hypothetical protein